MLLLSCLILGVLRELFDRDAACTRSPMRNSKLPQILSLMGNEHYLSPYSEFDLWVNFAKTVRIIAHTVPEPDDFEKVICLASILR
ncbi:hypothetical protein J1N35_040253 [Gossypium stocksii]|uniref:Uncharacterized protein n=1 Tax=Gossypium stocksii TaxID=47602 RepID=A0A9D3UDJ9_9ROSI|nr:hypothetical protein J1N35_040253 [Gossypium stocksii]